MSSIVVKAYWKKLNGGAEEIRRFSVDHDVSTSYAYLTEKIRLAFPSLRNRDFTTFWKDSDGDLITFSSDDDLMDALRHNMDKDLFRIYIEDVQPKSRHCGTKCPPASGTKCPPAGGTRCPPAGGTRCPPAGGTRCPPSSFGGLHPGVMCDGCDGPVFGTRFKCTVCPDYDLCTPCKSTGLHGEHQFMDIQELPLQNMFAEAMKLYQQATASGCTGGPCGERGQPEWMRWFRMPAPAAPENPNSQDKGIPTAAEGAKEAECRSNDECEQRKKQQEFLKNIGTFAAGLLNPFGFTSESDAKLTKEDANSSSSQSAKKETRSDQCKEGGCQGKEAGSCQSGNHTTAGGNAPGEARSSTSSTHESGKMGQSPKTSFGGLHPGVMCDGCDGPVFGTRFKCTVCPDYDLCTPCKSTGLHGEHQFMDIQELPLQNMFAEAMKLYQQATASGFAGGPSGERGCRMHAPQNPNPQDKAAAEGAKEAECRSNDECEQRKQQQEFLKNIGTFAAGLLNPFGFTSESDVKVTKEDTNSSSSRSAKKEMRSDQNQEGCQGREAGSCQSSNHGAQPGEMGHSPKTSADGSSTPNIHPNKEDQPDNAGQTTSSSNEQAVKACLQTLKEMGFSDDGGWLTSLVNVYQGIITHVLDAIQANQNQ